MLFPCKSKLWKDFSAISASSEEKPTSDFQVSICCRPQKASFHLTVLIKPEISMYCSASLTYRNRSAYQIFFFLSLINLRLDYEQTPW